MALHWRLACVLNLLGIALGARMVIIAFKLLLVVCFCALYALGGQGHKQFRRFVLPTVYMALCGLILWLRGVTSIVQYLALPLMFLACNPPVSYGEKYTHDKTALKVLFRGICGALYGIAQGSALLLTGHPLMAVFALLASTATSIALGVTNPFPVKWGNWATVAEDVCISLSYVTFLTMVL